MTFSKRHRGLSAGKGSYVKTSRAAPAIVPSVKASIKASSCTTPPRQTFTKYAFGFISLEFVGADHSLSLGRMRHDEAYVIALREKSRKLPELRSSFLLETRIEPLKLCVNYVHSKQCSSTSQFEPYFSHSNNPKRPPQTS